MKRATTLKKPKAFAAESTDADNPPWSEEMLGPATRKKGRGYQAQINDALRRVVERGLTTRSSGR
jgi:uncharacterized protein (DUF4415 family)